MATADAAGSGSSTGSATDSTAASSSAAQSPGAAPPGGAAQASSADEAARRSGQTAEAASQPAIDLAAGPNAPLSDASSPAGRADAIPPAGASKAAPIEATAAKISAVPLRISPDAADPELAAKDASAAGAARASAEGGEDSAAPDAAAATSPAQAASVSPSSGTPVNLALAEGSDATGATASALQSAQAATAAPMTAAQSPVPQNVAVPDSTQTVSPAALAAAAAPSALGSGGNTHDRGAPGESNAGGGDGAAALQQLTSNAASAPSDAGPVPSLRVNANVDSAEFPQSLADRVSFMVDNGWSSAKLQVNPPQLGPIELQIAVQGDHAQVLMSTHSALTRDALESSAPRLREMLSSQGFTQVNVDVSQRSFQERSAYTPPYAWTPSTANSTPPAAASSTAVPRTLLGAVDAYA
jgi:flagellar hook-length control protein FliK